MDMSITSFFILGLPIFFPGGHTTEMLRLLENLSNAYSPRHYIVADTDEMSTHKINSFEQIRADRNPSATVSNNFCV